MLEKTERLVLVLGRKGIEEGGVGSSEVVVVFSERVGVGGGRRGDGGLLGFVEVELDEGFVGGG